KTTIRIKRPAAAVVAVLVVSVAVVGATIKTNLRTPARLVVCQILATNQTNQTMLVLVDDACLLVGAAVAMPKRKMTMRQPAQVAVLVDAPQLPPAVAIAVPAVAPLVEAVVAAVAVVAP